jgi:hypothetical protein
MPSVTPVWFLLMWGSNSRFSRLAASVPQPGENAQTCGPGPFSMSNRQMVTKQLEIAGYTNIQFEQIDAQLFVGKDLYDALEFQLALGVTPTQRNFKIEV